MSRQNMMSALLAAACAAALALAASAAPDWGAAAVHRLLVGADGQAFPSEVEVRAVKDAAVGHVMVRSKLPPGGILRRVAKGAPGNAVRIDDCVLLRFSGGRGLAVNANGACVARGWEVPKSFACESAVTNGWWELACSLPLDAIGDENAFDVGRHFALAADGVKPNAWVAKNGSLFPGDDGVALQVLAIDGGAREYTVSGRVVNASAKAKAYRLELNGSPEASQAMALIRDLSLAPRSAEDFVFKGAILDDEKVVLAVPGRTWTVRPNDTRPSPFVSDASAAERVSFKFVYFPSFNKFRVCVDVKLLPDWRRDVKGVRLEIFDAKGAKAFGADVPVDERGLADRMLDIVDLRPLTVKSGEPRYRAKFTVLGVEGCAYEKDFYRGAFDWEGNRYGLSDTIAKPFTPMVVEEGGVFSAPRVCTILREHTLTPLGLMRQVKVPAREGSAEPTRGILAGGGMKLVARIGGRDVEVKGRDFRFEGPENPARRGFSSAFSADGFAGSVRGAWTYEGQLECFLTLERGAVESLKLVVPVKGEEAKLFHACVDTAKGNPAGWIPAGTGRVWDGTKAKNRHGYIGDHLSYVWVGGTLRGISVYGTNDRGWVLDDWDKPKGDVPCQEIVRAGDGTVSIVLNLVQRPFTFAEPRTIHLGFMATPVKPMLPGWRGIDPGFLFGGGQQYGAEPTDSIVPYDGTDTFWKHMGEARRTGKYDKEWLEGFIRGVPHLGPDGSEHHKSVMENARLCFNSGLYNCARHGFKVRFVWYTNPRGIQYWPLPGRTYCDEWNVFEFMDMDRDFNCMSKRDYCLNPNAAFRDYAAWWYRKMALSGAMDHLYWDVSYPKACWDLLGTEAYVTPDGRIQPDFGVFDMAALVKRAATVQAECGRDPTGNWVHMTDTAMAQLLAFGGVNFDWEDNVAPLSFQKKYPKDRIMAAVIGRQFGNRVKVIGHYAHVSDERDAWYRRTGTGVMLVHELYWKSTEKVYREKVGLLEKWGYRLPDTRVWNYWNGDEPYPLAVSGGENASIAMARGGEAAFVVCDYTDAGGVFRVRPDVAALGVQPGFRAYDMEDGSEVPVEDGEVSVRVKPSDFRMVVLK